MAVCVGGGGLNSRTRHKVRGITIFRPAPQPGVLVKDKGWGWGYRCSSVVKSVRFVDSASSSSTLFLQYYQKSLCLLHYANEFAKLSSVLK